jgi:hypothetical protein
MANLALARNKDSKLTTTNDLAKPLQQGSTVINIGSVHNYFQNGTVSQGGQTEQTFIIGNDPLAEPSMMWLEGGYADNHYLYYGNARMAVNGNEVLYNVLTSDDWTVIQNDPEQISPYEVSFSMTDELAGSLMQGFHTKQTVHAWSESYRDDFFIIEYDITNTSQTTFTDFYFWYHMDCDISAASGGSGDLGFWRDDRPSSYLGTDINGEPESISFMFDADNPNIAGDDTYGKLTPKESLGFIGSRIIDSPETLLGTPANQQSGHQWWDWNSDPQLGGEFYNLAIKHEFKADPGSPHDYRYMQIVGPYQMEAGETLHITMALGVGELLDGLRANLQWAYDLYWNDWQGPAAPNAPNTTISKGDGWVKVEWDDTTSENSRDPLSGEQDFEGYRVYRSLDRTTWTLLASYDLVNDIGENTGLPPKNENGLYEYLDEDVTNGFIYYYTIAAFDRGTATLPSLETGKTVGLFAEPGPPPTGNTVNEDLIRVVPNPFVVKAPWDFKPTSDNPSEERLQFQNVPRGAKITVFNLAGDMIIELQQEGEDGFVNWDLITRNTQKVVSGMYLYVVEPVEGDNFIDKFVIIR